MTMTMTTTTLAQTRQASQAQDKGRIIIYEASLVARYFNSSNPKVQLLPGGQAKYRVHLLLRLLLLLIFCRTYSLPLLIRPNNNK